jgi:hypothetical protein
MDGQVVLSNPTKYLLNYLSTQGVNLESNIFIKNETEEFL